MYYIILDMEWNQALDRAHTVEKPVLLRGEIIQIGAVKCDEDFNLVDRLKINVSPKYYKKMNRHVEKITGITNAMLAKGEKFPEAFAKLREWCTPEFRFITWGFDDIAMLADNLDPEGTPNARNTLFLYGQITSGLPLSLLLDPSFSPTEITFQVGVGADKASNDIPQTQLFAEDLRQIVEGITIRIPVTLTEYYPGKGFSDDQYQIVISLSLLKNGGLKLDI